MNRRKEFDANGPLASQQRPSFGLDLYTHTLDGSFGFSSAGGRTTVGLTGLRQGNLSTGRAYLIPQYRMYQGGGFVKQDLERGRRGSDLVEGVASLSADAAKRVLASLDWKSTWLGSWRRAVKGIAAAPSPRESPLRFLSKGLLGCGAIARRAEKPENTKSVMLAVPLFLIRS